MNDKVTIFFAGDFCSTPSPSLIKVSDDLRRMIQDSDFGVVNFEVPFKPEEKQPWQHRFRYAQHPEVPDFLRDLGFNLFSIATNHTFDWGDFGYLKTREALGDMAFGAGTYEEAYKVKVVEKNGVRVGFLAVCFSAYRGVFDDIEEHGGYGCAYINDLKVNHVIIEAKKELDYLFVLPHDGIEYVEIPSPEIIARYRDFIDYGADGVIGTHPHCPQGWEEYKGKPIFYSLGNFFFNSKQDTMYRATDRPHWYDGLCVVFSIGDEGLSYQIVNTKNTDNVGLSIDRNPDRDIHNEQINAFLTDKQSYDARFAKFCRQYYKDQMHLISIICKERSFFGCLKVIVRILMRYFTKKNQENDFEVYRILKSDILRSAFAHSIYYHNNKKFDY